MNFKKLKYLAITSLLFICCYGPAYASTIVYTGDGQSKFDVLNSALKPDYWYAAEFVMNSAYNITDIQGWMYANFTGDLTIALYSDGGDIPGTELFSGTLSSVMTGEANWYGLSGLNIELADGEYWVSFEIRDGQTFSGGMPRGNINPLPNGATHFNGLGWVSNDSLDIGILIEGNISFVPIPASFLLLGSGFISLLGLRKTLNRYLINKPV